MDDKARYALNNARMEIAIRDEQIRLMTKQRDEWKASTHATQLALDKANEELDKANERRITVLRAYNAYIAEDICI